MRHRSLTAAEKADRERVKAVLREVLTSKVVDKSDQESRDSLIAFAQRVPELKEIYDEIMTEPPQFVGSD